MKIFVDELPSTPFECPFYKRQCFFTDHPCVRFDRHGEPISTIGDECSGLKVYPGVAKKPENDYFPNQDYFSTTSL